MEGIHGNFYCESFWYLTDVFALYKGNDKNIVTIYITKNTLWEEVDQVIRYYMDLEQKANNDPNWFTFKVFSPTIHFWYLNDKDIEKYLSIYDPKPNFVGTLIVMDDEIVNKFKYKNVINRTDVLLLSKEFRRT